MKRVKSSGTPFRRWLAGLGCAGVAWLLSANPLGAQTVLLDEDFETFPLGEFWSHGGWSYVNDSTGWVPSIATNVLEVGTRSIRWADKNDSVNSPLLDVSRTDKIVVTFRMAQTPGLTYVANEPETSENAWWNDRFDLGVLFDGGAKTNVFRDYGLADGFTGYYTGTPLRAPRNNGVASGEFIDYEIAIDVAANSTVKLNFLGWSIATGGPRKHYLDTVKVVAISRGTMVIVK